MLLSCKSRLDLTLTDIIDFLREQVPSPVPPGT